MLYLIITEQIETQMRVLYVKSGWQLALIKEDLDAAPQIVTGNLGWVSHFDQFPISVWPLGSLETTFHQKLIFPQPEQL